MKVGTSLDKGALHTLCAGRKLLGTFLHIMQQAFFLLLCFVSFFFLEGCRAAAQLHNIRQEQMKTTGLLVGGKCQLQCIHLRCHCLLSLEVIASFPPDFELLWRKWKIELLS